MSNKNQNKESVDMVYPNTTQQQSVRKLNSEKEQEKKDESKKQ